MFSMLYVCHWSACTWVLWPQSWKHCLWDSFVDNRGDVGYAKCHIRFNRVYLLWCLSLMLTCFVSMHFQQSPLCVISHFYELCCAVSFCTIFDNSCSALFLLLKIMKYGFFVFPTFSGIVLCAWGKCSLFCSKRVFSFPICSCIFHLQWSLHVCKFLLLWEWTLAVVRWSLALMVLE